MTDGDVLEAHLRRLDDDATLALVADLWAARGYETARVGGAVVAERGGEVVALATPATRGSVPDAVGAPDGTRVEAVRVVDAADLRELLRYAVEPPVGDDLCRRHLGASPTNLTAPPGLAARRRLRAAGAWTPLAVALVAVLVGAALLAATTGGSDVGAPEPDVETTPEAAGDETDAEPFRPDDGVDDLPGANRSGVTDAEALAAAHERALRGDAYALWVDQTRPREWEEGAPRVQRDVDMTVEGERYEVVTSESNGRAASPSVLRRVYYDGSAWYVAENGDDGTAYRVVDEGDPPSVGRTPVEVEETFVRRFLSTPESEYAGYIDQEGEILYRFTGEGTPDGLALSGVSDYSFFAVVDGSGLVTVATVEYTLTADGYSADVRLKWTYGGFGETTLSQPSWHPALENRTDRGPPE